MRTPDLPAALQSCTDPHRGAPKAPENRSAPIYIPPHHSGLIGFIETVIRFTRRFCYGV